MDEMVKFRAEGKIEDCDSDSNIVASIQLWKIFKTKKLSELFVMLTSIDPTKLYFSMTG